MSNKLKNRIERIVQTQVQEGYYLRRLLQGYGGSVDNFGGCCLLGMIGTEGGRTLDSHEFGEFSHFIMAKQVLNLDDSDIKKLESDFESARPGTIGGYFAETYT